MVAQFVMSLGVMALCSPLDPPLYRPPDPLTPSQILRPALLNCRRRDSIPRTVTVWELRTQQGREYAFIFTCLFIIQTIRATNTD